MTALLDDVLDAKDTEPDPVPYASWGARLGAFALDVLPGAAVLVDDRPDGLHHGSG